MGTFLRRCLRNCPCGKRPRVQTVVAKASVRVTFQLFADAKNCGGDLFVLSASFRRFRCLPGAPRKRILLGLLIRPRVVRGLSGLLLSSLNYHDSSVPLRRSTASTSKGPVLLTCSFSVRQVGQFGANLGMCNESKGLVYFSFRVPILGGCLATAVRFSDVSLYGFGEKFLRRPWVIRTRLCTSSRLLRPLYEELYYSVCPRLSSLKVYQRFYQGQGYPTSPLPTPTHLSKYPSYFPMRSM